MPSANRPPSLMYGDSAASACGPVHSIFSLSPWERAGVRVRSLAGETKEKRLSSPRAVSPHPNPLPEGEGSFATHTLAWLSDAHAYADGSDIFARFFATRSARTVALPQPGAESLGLSAPGFYC